MIITYEAESADLNLNWSRMRSTEFRIPLQSWSGKLIFGERRGKVGKMCGKKVAKFQTELAMSMKPGMKQVHRIVNQNLTAD